MQNNALDIPVHSLNCRGQLLSLAQPRIMGILNLTPDSFSDGGQYTDASAAVAQVARMLEEGADIIDIGGASSRPGAAEVSAQEELDRVAPITEQLLQHFPQTLFSVDTFHAAVAEPLLDMGVHILNDITAGQNSPELFELAAKHRAPYVLMHMQGVPKSMQENPHYADVVADVYHFLTARLQAARAAGVVDVVLDPGFGFGKTLAHNYTLYAQLSQFLLLGCPLLVGISRKRMLTQGLGLSQQDALYAASALHYQALCQGVCILRVHDVAAAAAVRQLFTRTQEHGAV